MVLVQGGGALLELFYALALRQSAQPRQTRTAITVHILAAADVDGVCSARILDSLLVQAAVRHMLVPVTSNCEIVDHIRQLVGDPGVRSLVLLNCGAAVDLQQHLEESDAPPELTCFVIDSHRPFLRANLSTRHQRVVVLETEEETEEESVRGSTYSTAKKDTTNCNSRKRQRLDAETKEPSICEDGLASNFTAPTAFALFRLAMKVAPSKDHIWLAAVAVADSRFEFDRLNSELKEANNRMTESPTSSEEHQEPPPRRCSHHFEKELRLTLYKLWTLDEAARHSSYFSGALQLHRDDRRLKSLFAVAGIPPSEYQQQFGCMQRPLRESICSLLCSNGKAFALAEHEMLQEQCVRTFDYTYRCALRMNASKVSGQDAAHLVSALLTSTFTPSASARFWQAYDAALCKEPQIVREGVIRAVALAEAVQRTARWIREKALLFRSGTPRFCWCRLEEPEERWHHPAAAYRLAQWLLDVNFTHNGDHSCAAMLVIVRNRDRGTYLCVGATPHRLWWAQRFQRALRRATHVTVRSDFFDSSCIEIEADGFEEFWALCRRD